MQQEVESQRRKRSDSGRHVAAAPGEGERALMRSVLSDALRCIAGEVGAGMQQVRLAAEAREWVARRDDPWPFSFESICDWLGISADRLRSRVMQMPGPSGARASARRRVTLAQRDAQIRARHAAGSDLAALAVEVGISRTRMLQITRAERLAASAAAWRAGRHPAARHPPAR